MLKFSTPLMALAFTALVGAEALAADPVRCLTAPQRREAIAAKKAVPLGRAVRAARKKVGGGDVVGARLCEGEKGLVYMLTVLSGSGKVTRATIDAVDGQYINGR